MMPPFSSRHSQTFSRNFLAAEIVAGFLLLAQLALHHRLRRDARVVGARQPQRRLALEAGTADQDVLDRVVQHMAHRQHARDVGRRDHDRVGLLARA
jgi:hypothetical protein